MSYAAVRKDGFVLVNEKDSKKERTMSTFYYPEGLIGKCTA
jgi:hypothetical protein